MAEDSGIEWCDATFNPWWGCEKVSPGCAHCYADTLAKRRAPGQALWGAGHAFRWMSEGTWKKPLRWERLAAEGLLPNGERNRDGHRPRIFCASMADIFEDRDELLSPRERLFDLIEATPALDWLVLTKRPEFVQGMLDDLDRALPPSVWLGVSIENARHTYRADVLRGITAAVRFISAEPLLGSLFEHPRGSLTVPVIDGELQITGEDLQRAMRKTPDKRAPLSLTAINWVIVGGESGPGARPMRLEWASEIVRECDRENLRRSGSETPYSERLAVFVKQLGAKPIEAGESYAARIPVGVACEHGYDVCPICDAEDVPLKLPDRKGGDPADWPSHLRIREFPAVKTPQIQEALF